MKHTYTSLLINSLFKEIKFQVNNIWRIIKNIFPEEAFVFIKITLTVYLTYTADLWQMLRLPKQNQNWTYFSNTLLCLSEQFYYWN